MSRKESSSPQSEPIRVLWITPQCAPFAVMGGLGPIPLNMIKMFCNLKRTARLPDLKDIDARIVMPYYDIPNKCQYTNFRDSEIKWRTSSITVGTLLVHHLQGEYKQDNIHVYAIKNNFDGENLFAPLPTPNENDVVSGDDRRLAQREAERFAWFCRASLCFITNFLVNEEKWIPDILHCHDWQTGLTPIYLQYNWGQLLGNYGIRTLFTFHFSPGPLLQGLFAKQNCCPPPELLEVIELDGLSTQIYQPDDPAPNLRHQSDNYMPHLKEGVYYLKAGAAFATRFNTVSPNYGGMIDIGQPGVDPGLSGVLARRGFKVEDTSILLGTDPNDNPQLMPIAHNYNRNNCIQGKRRNKAELKEWFGNRLQDAIQRSALEQEQQELQKSQSDLQEFELAAWDFLVVFPARLDSLKGQKILLEQIYRIFSEMPKLKIITMGSVNPDPASRVILSSMQSVARNHPDRFLYIYMIDFGNPCLWQPAIFS